MDTIISYLNSTGKLFTDFALPMLIQSSALIVILLGLDFILRKRVRAIFRYCIWMLVLVKLVLPTSLAAPSGIMYWLNLDLPEVTHEESVIAGQPEILPPPGQAPSKKAMVPTPSPVDILPSATPIEPELIQSVSATPINSITSQAVIFLIWLSVVITMVLLLLQRLFFVRGLIAQSRNADSGIENTLVQSCRQMGIRRKISLKFSSNTATPSVCGLFRPVILIPADLPNKLDSDHLKAVLLHELAHIKRGDLWVSFVQTILQIIYFYNPLLWLANAVIRQVREQAVDEMVQVAMGEKADTYPETLVNVFRLSFSRPALGLRLIGVVESKSSLRRRVKHMINRPIPKTAKIGIVGLLTILITAAILLPMAQAQKKPAQSPTLQDKQQIEDVLQRWYKSCVALELESMQKTYSPSYSLSERDMREMKILLGQGGNPELKFALLSILWDKQDALAVSHEIKQGDPKVGGPMVLVWSLKKKGAGWKITDIDLDSAENLQIDNSRFLKKYPSAKVWFDDPDLKVELYAINKPMAQSPTLPDENKSKFVATLPNGVTVELVGVCEHPSKGKQWWRPDGSELEEIPYDSIGVTSYADQPQREFVIRLTNLPEEEISYRWDFIPPVSGVGGSHPKDQNGKNIEDIWTMVAEMDESAKTTTIRFGVSSDKWQTRATFGGKGRSGISRGDYAFHFSRPYTRDNHTYVIVSDNIIGSPCRLLAIDKDGKAHDTVGEGSSAGNVRQSTFGFKNLPIENIHEFQFQTRSYQWVTFKNVSLKPNSKTDVQIEVDSEVQRAFIPDADTKGVDVVLDLATGELLPAGEGEQQLVGVFDGMGRGDLAYDRMLICLRGGKAELWDGKSVTHLLVADKIQDATAYKLETIPCRLLITTAESNKFDVTVLSKDKNGINIKYHNATLKPGHKTDVQIEVEKVNRVGQSPTLPIAYWNFDGNAKDSIGNNHGIVYGATLTEGISGQAYYFEGDGDCISIPDSAKFDFGGGDFTISAWFRTNVNKAPFPFIVNFRQNDNNPHIELYAGRDVGSHSLPGFTRLTYRDAGINDDKWHHMVIALKNRAKDGYKLYLDGFKVSESTYVGRLEDWDTITIGAQRKGGNDQHAFKGFIDEVAIYNRALSAEEIQNIYNTIQITEKPDRKTDVQVEEKKTDETIARRLAKPFQRTSRLKQRTESMGKLRKIGLALVIYANEHNEKYPDSLDKLKSYIQDDVLDWAKDNVEYFGRGKSITTDPQTAIAYDKTLLKKENSQGTNVLYSDTHVAFRKTKQLKQQGLIPKDKTIQRVW